MDIRKIIVVTLIAAAIGLSGCNREQSAWEKARAANNTDSYEQFVKKYPQGSFTAQAAARLKELYEERDWQKARDTDTADAYQAFLKDHPEGKWAEEARIRIENFALAQPPAGTTAPGGANTAPAEEPQSTKSTAKETATAHVQERPEAAAPKSGVGKAAKSAAGGAGAYGLQLGAFKAGKAAALKHWQVLEKKFPSALHGLKSSVHSTKSGAGQVYRLQVAGLTSAHAHSICRSLKAKKQPCLVLPPAHKVRHPHVKH